MPDFPQLAQSNFLIGPSQGWKAAWEYYVASAYRGDTWEPEDWGKPLAVKDIRELRAFAGRQSVGSGAFIAIPMADLLSREVGNALLKLLEEPPPDLTIILFAETDRMLATIRSRVRLLSLGGEFSQVDTAAERLNAAYRTLDAAAQPARAKRMLYYAPLLHATVQTDSVLDAFTPPS